jgi:hypothetical protein
MGREAEPAGGVVAAAGGCATGFSGAPGCVAFFGGGTCLFVSDGVVCAKATVAPHVRSAAAAVIFKSLLIEVSSREVHRAVLAPGVRTSVEQLGSSAAQRTIAAKESNTARNPDRQALVRELVEAS